MSVRECDDCFRLQDELAMALAALRELRAAADRSGALMSWHVKDVCDRALRRHEVQAEAQVRRVQAENPPLAQ